MIRYSGFFVASPQMSLTGLPDDVLRLVLAKCTVRSLVCAASTCRTLRDLALDSPLGTVTLTCTQSPAALRWLWSETVAPRVRTLVARRCLYGACRWLTKLPHLRRLTLAFCRVRVSILGSLPPTLEHLDIHTLLPVEGRRHMGLSLRMLPRLRVLRLVFQPYAWEAAFVSRLPRGLRELRLRGCRALVVESFMPKGLRDVALHATALLVMSNRLPNTVRRVDMRCDYGNLWLADTLPLKVARLHTLVLRSPLLACVPRLSGMRNLRVLHVKSRTHVTSCRALAATRLRDLEIHADDWIGFTDTAWPAERPPPERVVATVGDVRLGVPIGLC